MGLEIIAIEQMTLLTKEIGTKLINNIKAP